MDYVTNNNNKKDANYSYYTDSHNETTPPWNDSMHNSHLTTPPWTNGDRTDTSPREDEYSNDGSGRTPYLYPTMTPIQRAGTHTDGSSTSTRNRAYTNDATYVTADEITRNDIIRNDIIPNDIIPSDLIYGESDGVNRDHLRHRRDLTHRSNSREGWEDTKTASGAASDSKSRLVNSRRERGRQSSGERPSSGQKEDTMGVDVRRSWPEPRDKGERRIVASNYSAVEIHGFFGLIDDGSVGEGRMLIVHVPKWIRGYFLDIRQGDTLHVYHANGGKIGGVLTVLSTGRHKYYAPGRRVTTCTICVPEEQWAPFSGH